MEKVRERLLRAAAALEKASVPYAVIGGNAVAAWVAKVNQSAVGNTPDVEILIRRADLDAASEALAGAGFLRRHIAGVDLFLDGPNSETWDAVRLVFADEKIRKDHTVAAPSVNEAERADSFFVLGLEALLRMKLTSFRDKDRTHVRDLLDVGLIDGTWCSRLPAQLAERLQQLIANPNG